MHFLYPAHPLRPTVVEPTFADEFSAIDEVGFTESVFADAVITEGKPLRSIPVGETVVYRGWMFNSAEYQRLVDAITASQAKPLVSHQQYLAAHHCPNWYPLLAQLTPETHCFTATEEIERKLQELNWGEFFVKDFVKSLKTSGGLS